jgi:hypothetical protein
LDASHEKLGIAAKTEFISVALPAEDKDIICAPNLTYVGQY